MALSMTTLAAAAASTLPNLTSSYPPHPVAPIPYDFAYCHSYYGSNLQAHESAFAGSKLPQGADPQQYYINDPTAPFHLPFTITHGNIQITVEAAIGWTAAAYQYITIRPNEIRGMAGYVSEACVGNRQLGGFITRRFTRLVNYALLPDTNLEYVPYPGDTLFLTLTMMTRGMPEPSPGDFDPEVPRQLGNVEVAASRSQTAFPRDVRMQFAERSIKLGIQASNMRRSLRRAWWLFPYGDEGVGAGATNETAVAESLDDGHDQDAGVSPATINRKRRKRAVK